MAKPIKVSDELASAAREESAAASRSMTAQLEHWATLGRAVEKLLDHRELLALKRLGGGAVASVGSPRARVTRVLEELARSTDRSAALAHITAVPGPRYGVDDEGRLVRVDPSGARTTGTLVDGEFVADEVSDEPRRGM
ncbi:MAG: hypothetical protein KF901_15890 [Myxococcales bacterium]|nr:hypothetical protein [Myxococcales bacterium]